MLETWFRILSIALCAGIIASSVAGPLQAQSQPSDSGSVTRVRVETAESRVKAAGLLIGADDRRLVIRPSDSSTSVEVTWENVKRLEVSKGSASFGRRLFTRSLVGGMTMGGLLGMLPPCGSPAATSDCPNEELESRAANYMIGAFYGGVFGALIAIFPGKERWREVDANSARAGATPDQWKLTGASTYTQRVSRNVKWAGYAGAATGVLFAATYSKDCEEGMPCPPVGVGDRVFIAAIVGWAATAFGSTIGALVAIVPTGGDRAAQQVSVTAPSLPRGQTGVGLALSW